jgi:hypothetical protein
VSAILLATLAVPRARTSAAPSRHPAVPRVIANGLRDRMRVVPIDDSASSQHLVWQGRRRRHGGGYPAALGGGSGPCTRISRRTASIVGNTPPKPWVTPERPVERPSSAFRTADGAVRDERSATYWSHGARRSSTRAPMTSSATSAPQRERPAANQLGRISSTSTCRWAT